jgi:ribosomal protein L27
VRGEVISYAEMCRRERAPRLRRGMNFGLGGDHSVMLTKRRGLPSPYGDQFSPDNRRIVYRGHDAPRRVEAVTDPKFLDQPAATPTGRPTQNARFLAAAEGFRRGERAAERVRLYEKLEVGVWEDLGLFHLVDGWTEHDGRRTVFKFLLELPSDAENGAPG